MASNFDLVRSSAGGLDSAISAALVDIRPPDGFYGDESHDDESLHLWNIGKAKQTEEMVAIAVRHSAENLQYASKKHLTREICIDAVARCGRMLKYVPKRFVDEEMCRAALNQDPLAVYSIPDQYQTHDMWVNAVESSEWALGRVPDVFLDEEICIAAVRKCGRVLERVPTRMKTSRVCYEAVKSDGRALLYVPNGKRNSKTCLAAVRADGRALEFVPKKLVDDQIIATALASDGEALQFLPKNRRTKARCEIAIESNPRALIHVPDKFKTEGFCGKLLDEDPSLISAVPEPLRTAVRCMQAVELAWEKLQYVPQSEKSAELCECALKQSWKALRYFPEELMTVENVAKALKGAKEELDSLEYGQRSLRNRVADTIVDCPIDVMHSPEIASLERQLGVRLTLEKRYEASSNQFIVTEKEKRPEGMFFEREIEKRFDSFKEFYDYVSGDLSEADLFEFDFDGVDVSSLDLSEARVNPEIVDPAEAGMKLYGEIALLDDPEAGNAIDVASDESGALLHASEIGEFDPASQRRVFYVTDIHLDHCIANWFPERASDGEIRGYIADLVDQLVEERKRYDDRTYNEKLYAEVFDTRQDDFTPERKVRGTLLIGGDVSHSYAFSEIFFSELAKRWNPSDVIVIMGNHELWECKDNSCTTAEENVATSVARYRALIGSLGMAFVHDELLILLRNLNWMRFSGEQILDGDSEYEIRYFASRASLVVFGGMGFSGLAPKFNADSGIYRHAIQSLEDDRRLAKGFELIYNKVAELLSDKKIIVFTHMPYWVWSSSKPVAEWVYVSGHTHHNEYRNDEGLTLLADNQIGYHRTDLGLKHFIMRKRYDVFEMYGDGVYVIDDRQYTAFNRGLGIDCQFTRGDQVLMLKRAGFYMFVFPMNGKYYLLEGGRIHNLDHQNLDYYYDRMSEYAQVVKLAMGAYMGALERISKAVKAFGGEGGIHGTIVDIDFFNHIYLNPFDGKMSYYYAESVVEKYFYDDLPSLLSERASWLLPGYTAALLEAGEDGYVLSGRDVQLSEVRDAVQILDTTMYQPSRVMRSIQYLFETNVIRVWNEDALDAATKKRGAHQKGNLSHKKPLLSGESD